MRPYDNSLSHGNYSVAENFENLNKPDLSHVKHLLWMVFAASRGGQNRIRIIFALKRSPLNAHQLTKELDLNYRATHHHLEVLEKNNLVSHIGQKYGTNYFPSTLLEVNMRAFDELVLDLSQGKQERKGVYYLK
jgi:DNA-binding transcriptional ArsR family regulator